MKEKYPYFNVIFVLNVTLGKCEMLIQNTIFNKKYKMVHTIRITKGLKSKYMNTRMKTQLLFNCVFILVSNKVFLYLITVTKNLSFVINLIPFIASENRVTI